MKKVESAVFVDFIEIWTGQGKGNGLQMCRNCEGSRLVQGSKLYTDTWRK